MQDNGIPAQASPWNKGELIEPSRGYGQSTSGRSALSSTSILKTQAAWLPGKCFSRHRHQKLP
jgi:hypothetical protein